MTTVCPNCHTPMVLGLDDHYDCPVCCFHLNRAFVPQLCGCLSRTSRYNRRVCDGRFSKQCTIVSCPLRKLLVVKNEAGIVTTVIYSSACTGNTILYQSKELEI